MQKWGTYAKKLRNDLLLLFYPLLLFAGIWREREIMQNAARTFQVPFFSMILLHVLLIFFLGLFVFYFLVLNVACNLPAILIGAAEPVVLFILSVRGRFSGIVFTMSSQGYFILEIAFVLYLALIVRTIREKV